MSAQATWIREAQAQLAFNVMMIFWRQGWIVYQREGNVGAKRSDPADARRIAQLLIEHRAILLPRVPTL